MNDSQKFFFAAPDIAVSARAYEACAECITETTTRGDSNLTSTPRLTRLLMSLVAAFLLVGIAPALPAQGRAAVGVIGREVTTSVDRSSLVQLPFAATHVAVHWRGSPDANVAVAFSADGTTFGSPEAVEHDEAGKHSATRHGIGDTFGGVMWTSGARFVNVTSDQPITRLSVVAINSRAPGKTAEGTGVYVAAAAVDQPAIVSRSGWSADESLRYDDSGNELWPPDFHPIQKLTVHHTAGKNSDPDPAATVRAILYYQAVTRGWGDIGYNFLIDEAGQIYEGRYSRAHASGETPTGEDLNGNGVTGAHVGGYNAGTVGVALLGTLTEQGATPAARAALEQLLAWKAERHAIDPLGSGMYINPVSGAQKQSANISGHRDWAATECPGGEFYASLPALRNAVATRISGTPPAQTVPGAPVLTAAPPNTGKGVKLNWTVPSDGGSPITQFRVLRGTTGNFLRIATVGPSVTSYRDKSTKRGRTYTYVVRAVNALGTGALSNEASATAR